MIETVLAGVVILIVGYFLAQRFETLKKKSDEELYEMLAPGSDPKFHRNALLELRGRGRNIDDYVMGFLEMMISESKVDRGVGWALLKEIYPDVAARIEFDPYQDLDTCKAALKGIILKATLS